MSFYKYAVIKTISDNLDVELLSTFNDHKNATEYMLWYVNKNHKNIGYERIYNEKQDVISIWETGLLYGKTIKQKYHLVKYITVPKLICEEDIYNADESKKTNTKTNSSEDEVQEDGEISQRNESQKS